jgi:hypothetical protein
MSRSCIIHLVMYNLEVGNPGRDFFRWKEDICGMIEDLWPSLCPGKPRMLNLSSAFAEGQILKKDCNRPDDLEEYRCECSVNSQEAVSLWI